MSADTIVCPDCNGRPKEPSVRIEGGSRSCRHCNRTLTFNFMRDQERGERPICTCEAARRESCPTCLGDGSMTAPVASPSTDTAGDLNRWTASTTAVTADYRRVDFLTGDGVVTWTSLPNDQAESLAVQINRPTPDPDLRSKIEGLRAASDRVTAASLAWDRMADEPRVVTDEEAEWKTAIGVLRVRVLALLDAGEPPTGSGCA